MSEPRPLRLLILGAHPDDAELHAGGLAAIYRQAGHQVKMISVTCGDAGHHQLRGPELAARRHEEARAAAAVIGAESEVWEHPDGQLEPTLERRWQVIRELRTYRPDLVLTHRTNDYHPDHRATSHLVRDASYLVTVPAVLPVVPILERPPVIAFLPDSFTKPYPLVGDVVIDVEPVFETMVEMVAAHQSQVYEWLPFNRGAADEVPSDEKARRAWLADWLRQWIAPRAQRYRSEIEATFGSQRSGQIALIEMFEISEYAAPLDEEARRRLFWFLPQGR